MQHSLGIDVEYVDGKWLVAASWLKEPIVAATWFEAYWSALRARH